VRLHGTVSQKAVCHLHTHYHEDLKSHENTASRIMIITDTTVQESLLKLQFLSWFHLLKTEFGKG
jgi:hypothetical protein